MVDYSITYPFTREAAEAIREPMLAVVLDLIKAVKQTEDGYILVFGRVPQSIQPVAQLMQIERLMNPFMRMSLVVESNEGPVKLEMSGPTGTREFLFSEYGLKRWITS